MSIDTPTREPPAAADIQPYNRAARGGHFAAWEERQLLAEELRAAFRPLRSAN